MLTLRLISVAQGVDVVVYAQFVEQLHQRLGNRSAVGILYGKGKITQCPDDIGAQCFDALQDLFLPIIHFIREAIGRRGKVGIKLSSADIPDEKIVFKVRDLAHRIGAQTCFQQ